MADDNTKIGFHVNKTTSTAPSVSFKTMLEAIQDAHEKKKINVMQIYSHVSRSGKAMNLDFEAIKEYINKNNIELYTHGSYPTISVYKNEKVERLTSELDYAQRLGAKGVVIHINKYSPEQIIATLKKHRKIWELYNVPILIENSAYTSKNDKEYSYNTINKINKLSDMIRKEFPDTYVACCLDTAHLFSAGVDPSTWVNLKLDNVKLIHLNGSEKTFESGVDKHAIPFYKKSTTCKADTDNIPKAHLINFIKYCKSKNKPMVIEANRGETEVLLKTINKIRKL